MGSSTFSLTTAMSSSNDLTSSANELVNILHQTIRKPSNSRYGRINTSAANFFHQKAELETDPKLLVGKVTYGRYSQKINYILRIIPMGLLIFNAVFIIK
jgi:hypothetical protein